MVKLTKKGGDAAPEGNPGAPGPVYFPWDAALKGIATGAYDVNGDPQAERGPDQPGAQTPAPGTKPLDGSDEKAAEGDTLTNIAKVSSPGAAATGLPKDPPPAQSGREPAPKAPAQATK